jgi:hypothetical protein
MAAIIAKITRENRERIKRRKNTWGIRKSRYSLGSFKDHFDPEEDVKVFNCHLGCRFYNFEFTFVKIYQVFHNLLPELLFSTFRRTVRQW